jgi:tellurite resistance protein TehA-like permease
VLGKVARHNFPLTGTLSLMPQAGGIFYLIGLILGIILWSFALVWFIVAIIMIATAVSFPFNMGWWGFIFPVGKSKFCPKADISMSLSLCRNFYALNNLYR